MKKILYLMSSLILTASLQSCSDDDDAKQLSKLEKDYFSIEDATYVDGSIPSATTSEQLEGIDMSDQVMNGAMNYVTVLTDQEVSKFFIGIKGVSGYWEYAPESQAARSGDGINSYVIPIMISQNYTGTATIILSGRLEDGAVTSPIERNLHYIETMPGAIEIKLAFSNSKDIDLHLFTPGGEHIFYGNRGGTFTNEEGEEITYGLDIDSNAGCALDHINKENIYIPAELVEDGTYRVVVDMYSNCQPSIATSWSIVARFQGELIRTASGSNPASGRYEIDAPNGDMTEVMTFKIANGKVARSDAESVRASWSFTPAPLSETDLDKIASLEDGEED